jgi:hypothetical protein
MPSCKEFKRPTIASLIEMFNVCPFGDGTTSMLSVDGPHVDMIKDGIKRGYLIHPACDASYIAHFLASRDMQYNSTFYKTWNDVTNKSRFELFVDQVLHYMTTYGTDFSMEAYLPNVNPEEPAFNTYKAISPITLYDLYVKCLGMLQSGIALKSDTVAVLTDYIITFAKSKEINVDVDSIKNREALIIICDALGVLPKDGVKLFSHIMYKTTGQTMIIKNRDTRNRIQMKMNYAGDGIKKLWKSLDENQMIALAGVYNRYKELFLSFKNHKDASMNKIINKIGHLSKKHHKPMKRGFWETVLHSHVDEVVLRSEASKATNFKLIQVMQSIRERLLMIYDNTPNMILVRNGKIFIKDNTYSAEEVKFFDWETKYNVCLEQLINNLSKKACKIKLPKQYVLTCPTSEKNFIGDFPMGTYCQMGENSVIGIYWRNDWGTRDFDLSFNDINGNRIGWNSDYYNEDQSVIYSGDITNAPNGANEVLHFRGTENHPIPNGVVNINRYNGTAGSKYKVFFGTDDWANVKKADTHNGNYMVDPNKLQLEATMKSDEMSQQTIGMVVDSKFYFYSLSCGYAPVTMAIRHKNGESKFRYSGESYKKSANEMIDIVTRKLNSMISLEVILNLAGFEIVEDDADIDLTLIDRSKLIELFS